MIGVAVLLTWSWAAPAFAVKEWHDHYLDARDRLIPAKRYDEAIASLNAAIRLKPRSGLNEQTYGLQFIHYVPYLQLAICYLRKAEYNQALRMLDTEERQGAVGRDPDLRKQLDDLRQEAETLERQRVARQLRAEVRRLEREAAELRKAEKLTEALARLAEAFKAAEGLDPETQKRIVDLRESIHAEMAAREQERDRRERLEAALAAAREALRDNRNAEALVKLGEALAIEPGQPEAEQARKLAQERILATQTREAREARFREAKRLVELGQFQAAQEPLTEVVAADPSNHEAAELLDKVQGTLERMREQVALRLKVAGLLQDAERLIAARSYAEAQVQLERAIELDPTHPGLQDRLSYAERMTGETVLARWIPNRPPVLMIFAPQQPEVEIEGPSLAVVGWASDDRAVDKVAFSLGGRPAGELRPPDHVESEDSLRILRIEKEFPLEPGLNRITVTATDSMGLSRHSEFLVTRRLRFYESRAFLPSAFLSAVGLLGVALLGQQLRRRRAVRRRFNPYIAGAPVLADDMFFGREKLLDRILNVLHRNSLMITGERRIGKTTLLYHLRKRLQRDDHADYRFFPVLTDLQGVAENIFFHALMTDVVEDLAVSETTLLSMRFRPEAPAYDGRDFSHDLQRVIGELKQRTSKRVRLVLLIDEVDVLNEYSERVNQRLRSIFMKTFSEQLVAIMSGVGIRRTWNSEGSPWYNFFDEIQLSPFSREEAEALIREPVAGIFRWKAEAVERILDLSRLRPYLVQKYCVHSLNHMLEQGRFTVRLEDVEAARVVVEAETEESEPEAPPDSGVAVAD